MGDSRTVERVGVLHANTTPAQWVEWLEDRHPVSHHTTTDSLLLDLERQPAAVAIVDVAATLADGRSAFEALQALRTPVIVLADGALNRAVGILNRHGAVGIASLPAPAEAIHTVLDRLDAQAAGAVEEAASIEELRSALERMRAQMDRVEREAVANAASVDEDTGLWDRPHLIERLEDEGNRLQRYGIPFGAVMMDIPAHLEVAMAELLQDFLRKVDVCARFSPSLFVLVCPSTDDAGMKRLPQRLVLAMTNAHLPGSPSGDKPPVSLSAMVLDRPPVRADDILERLKNALDDARNGTGVALVDAHA